MRTFNDRARRRAAALLLGLVVTGLLAFLALQRVAPRYEATASVMMLPGEGNIPTDANPFLYLGALAQTRDVLVKIVNSEGARAQIIGSSADVDYQVQLDFTASAPILEITATGPSAGPALALRDSVLDFIPEELDVLQDRADTPEDSRMTSMVLLAEPEANRQTKQRIRALVAAGALGLGLTIGAVAIVDAIPGRRRVGQASSGSTGTPEGEPNDVEAVPPNPVSGKAEYSPESRADGGGVGGPPATEMIRVIDQGAVPI